MKLANVVPNEISYNSVVDALAKQGNAEGAEHWLQQ
jgi:pentatricopeptide repeat protein